MITIKELVSGLKTVNIKGNAGTEVTDIQLDSRKVAPGCLFVAMRGTTVDGHQFIPKAIELGASAVLCETLPEQIAEGVTFVQVADCEVETDQTSVDEVLTFQSLHKFGRRDAHFAGSRFNNKDHITHLVAFGCSCLSFHASQFLQGRTIKQ